MHELGITRNIVAIVSDAAKGRAVRRVTLEIGALTGVMAEAIAFCFDEVARGTPVEGAVLEIRRIEGRARCADCGTELVTETLFTLCACGSRQLVRQQGDELKIKTVEFEEAA